MLYYIIQEDKLTLFDDDKKRIEDTLVFMPQLKDERILETDIVTEEELRQYPNKVLVDDIQIEIDVPDYETIVEEYEEVVYEFENIEEEYQEMVVNEEGLPVVDEQGLPIYETKTRVVEKPIMIDVEQVVLTPLYDEQGNFIENKEETIIVQQQKSHIETKTRENVVQTGSHKETITVKGLVLNPDFETEEMIKEKARIQELYMTRSDFFDGTIDAWGVGEDELLLLVKNLLVTLPLENTKKLKAVNNFKNALNFYRKHDLFKMLINIPIQLTDNIQVVLTEDSLDKFFDEVNKGNKETAWQHLPQPVVIQ